MEKKGKKREKKKSIGKNEMKSRYPWGRHAQVDFFFHSRGRLPMCTGVLFFRTVTDACGMSNFLCFGVHLEIIRKIEIVSTKALESQN